MNNMNTLIRRIFLDGFNIYWNSHISSSEGTLHFQNLRPTLKQTVHKSSAQRILPSRIATKNTILLQNLNILLIPLRKPGVTIYSSFLSAKRIGAYRHSWLAKMLLLFRFM